jgi:hypothetical protein
MSSRTMTVAAEIPLLCSRAPTARHLQELADAFLQDEEASSKAYKVALDLDGPLERAKERLLLLVEQWGTANGQQSTILHAQTHDLVATVGSITMVNELA